MLDIVYSFSENWEVKRKYCDRSKFPNHPKSFSRCSVPRICSLGRTLSIENLQFWRSILLRIGNLASHLTAKVKGIKRWANPLIMPVELHPYASLMVVKIDSKVENFNNDLTHMRAFYTSNSIKWSFIVYPFTGHWWTVRPNCDKCQNMILTSSEFNAGLLASKIDWFEWNSWINCWLT